METKIIVFSYYKGWNDVYEEEFEFDVDATDIEIEREFEDWVWGIIGDSVIWREKE